MHGKGKGGLITGLVFLILATLFSFFSTAIQFVPLFRNFEEYKNELAWLLPFPISTTITFILIIVIFVLIGNYKRVNQAAPMYLVFLALFFSYFPYSWKFIIYYSDSTFDNFISWHHLLLQLVCFIMFILHLASTCMKSRVMLLISYIFSIFAFLFFLISNGYMFALTIGSYEVSEAFGHAAVYMPFLMLIEIVYLVFFITSIVLAASCSKRLYKRYNQLEFDDKQAKLMFAALAVLGFQKGLYSRETMNNELDNLTSEERTAVQELIHNPEVIKQAETIFSDYQFARDFNYMKHYIMSHR